MPNWVFDPATGALIAHKTKDEQRFDDLVARIERLEALMAELIAQVSAPVVHDQQ